ncbi:calcium-independent phospholipase A2-gamma-like [Engraulis encrasicolus]|uniref:calcium-independent phospholipase A2-gamma-like n=1 Tax=Engraulis encrasicolus TaxID=184585 RepID=UPI002FD4BF7A
MGRYLSTNFVTYLGARRLRCYSKISCVRRPHVKNTKAKPRNLNSTNTFWDVSRRWTLVPTPLCQQPARLYSTSSRNVFKAQAPIGIYPEEKPTFQLRLLGMRLGESFQRLSRHINVYFKQGDPSMAPSIGNGALVYPLHDPQRRQLRRTHTQRSVKERRSVVEERRIVVEERGSVVEERSSVVEERSSVVEERNGPIVEAAEASPPQEQTTTSRLYSGLQLFHISSLASRFGESYSYVAGHINSVFTRNPFRDMHAKVDVSEEYVMVRHGRRRKTLKTTTDAAQPSADKDVVNNTNAQKVNITFQHEEAKDNILASSSEEGYLHFSHHINRYFGAKVIDSQAASVKAQPNFRPHSHTQGPPQPPHPNSPSLFHMSETSTSFGANHAHIASHINHFFKGPQGFEDDLEGDYVDHTTALTVVAPPKPKTTSFMESLLQTTTAVQDKIGSYLGLGSKNQEAQVDAKGIPMPPPAAAKTAAATRAAAAAAATRAQRTFLDQRKVEEMIKVLLNNLRSATLPSTIFACTEELNRHLIAHPALKAIVWQEKIALLLLRHRRNHRQDVKLQRSIREAMALIGYLEPVKGRGVRVLSIDGGGTRGVVPLEVLRIIEKQTGKRTHELFDYICGVSTGAVLAFMVGLGRFSLDDCEEMYRGFGSDVFKQNPLVGTMKMGWTHSYYSTQNWETLLKEKMGERVLIKTARSEHCPKVSAVSAVVNWGTSPKAFMFRNYNHAPGKMSRYPGGSSYKLWEAVRASSAAPGYFREFPLHSDIHQDGGLIQNNPCALAVHECRLLWPGLPFQCVLSLGTGRYDNTERGPATSTSLRAKLSHLIYSATDTEGVHTLLDDLLADDVYFRFNPMLSAEVALDESRTHALDQLQTDTLQYLDRNRDKIERLCDVLRTERTVLSKSTDWITEMAWELKHRWA